MPNMVFSDVGPVSAYAIAKEHGYMGTEQEWAQEQAAAGTYAHAAKLEKEGAERARAQAEEAAAAAAKSDSAASQKVIDANNAADRAAGSAQASEGSAQTAAAHETEAGKQAATAAAEAEEAGKSAGAAKAEADRAAKAADRADAAAKQAETLIDNTVLADNKTWSSKNIVDRLCSPFNQKAPIVQGELVVGYPITVKSYIEPVQEGEGDPSPENKRPIHGVTELKLVKCRKNLIVAPYANDTRVINGVTFTVNPDGSIAVKGTASAKAVFFIADVFKFPFLKTDGLILSAGSGNWSYNTITVEVVSSSVPGGKQTAWNSVGNGNATTPLVFGKYVKSVYIMVQSGVSVDATVRPQLFRAGNEIPYEPYHGKTFTQTLPEEIMGGVYNWDTGELMVTKKKVGKDLLWHPQETDKPNVQRFIAAVPNAAKSDVKDNPAAISNKFKLLNYGETAAGTLIGFTVNQNKIYALPTIEPNFTSEQMSALNAEFVVPLETPEVIQLPKHLILSQPGITTVYSSAGDTEVTARKDPNAERAQMQRDIAALQDAIIKQ